MNSEHKKQTSITDFIKFIRNLWGSLAAITAFFPFFGNLLGVLEPPYFMQELVITVGNIGCIFIVISVYFMVSYYGKLFISNKLQEILPGLLFLLGFISIVVYFSLSEIYTVNVPYGEGENRQNYIYIEGPKGSETDQFKKRLNESGDNPLNRIRLYGDYGPFLWKNGAVFPRESILYRQFLLFVFFSLMFYSLTGAFTLLAAELYVQERI
jgi:hypothetical protein